MLDFEARDRHEAALVKMLHSRRAELADLLERCSNHWGYEDPVYRFYHQSWKVFGLQTRTKDIVKALQSLAPDLPLNEWFQQIVAEGTATDFNPTTNEAWLKETRPIVEAFFHARFMLEMAVRYSELPESPRPLPSGWAAFLYLFNLR